MRPTEEVSTASSAQGFTDDAFIGGALRLLQPAKGYRAGLDAVLLAAAAPIGPADVCDVLDAGSGVGTVGLCVARRCAGTHVTLLEREPALADLARQNAQRNDLADRVTVIEADMARGGAIAQGAGGHEALRPAMFDHLLANPPYRVIGSGTAPMGLKAAAHQLGQGDLERWMAALATLARSDATLTLIHEAAALAEVLAALDGRFGALRILPIHPRVNRAATRILVQGRKASRAPLVLQAGFVLHQETSGFTPEAEAILRHGAALTL
ncbi:MAG: tRNA1(Val) (adenine(37)-N6)-methyltransferase [Hyphomicrobiaceae bacterium]